MHELSEVLHLPEHEISVAPHASVVGAGGCKY